MHGACMVVRRSLTKDVGLLNHVHAKQVSTAVRINAVLNRGRLSFHKCLPDCLLSLSVRRSVNNQQQSMLANVVAYVDVTTKTVDVAATVLR